MRILNLLMMRDIIVYIVYRRKMIKKVKRMKMMI